MAAFGAAVRSLVSNPSMPIGQLSLTDRSQKSQIANWNSSSPVQVPHTLDELVKRNSSRSPLSTALKSTTFNISYGDLDNYSHRLAQWLVSKGVGPGQVVTLCFEKSVWGIVAMCGVQRAGGAFSHLDPGWPRQRCSDIIVRTKSIVGLASPSMQDKASGLLEHVLAVDMDIFALMKAFPDSEVEISRQNPQNLAYIISTSGSTGKPKIVAIPQIAISTALSAQIVRYKINENSRVAQFASYVFDSSILEIFGTLVAGGCVCVPSQEERMSDFASFVRRMDVNLLDVTPSLMRTISPADVPSVKVSHPPFLYFVTDIMTLTILSGALTGGRSFGPVRCRYLGSSYILDQHLWALGGISECSHQPRTSSRLGCKQHRLCSRLQTVGC